MADSIILEAIPSQQFVVPLGGYSYDIRIFSTDGAMAYDLAINGEYIIRGFEFVNEVLMLPYEYQELNGNLLLIVPDDEFPDYQNFGSTQFLAYLSADETVTYRDSL